MLRDGIKYRLELSWRATNDRKNVARCSLLFQSLGELTVTIGEVYPLSEAARAHEDLIARRTSGKLLLDPSK